MQPAFKNPVTNNPWASNMPNNFRGCQAASKKRPPEPAELNKKSIRRQPSKKLQITRNYVEQLVPLYPFLSKTQVRSGVILANNNLHHSRLLLDLANKCLTIPALNLVMNFHPTKFSTMEGKNNTDGSFSTVVMPKSVVPCATTGHGKKSNSVKGNRKKLSGSSSSSDECGSSEYDFSDSEGISEPIEKWSMFKEQIIKKKIGVSIIKGRRGYQAFLL